MIGGTATRVLLPNAAGAFGLGLGRYYTCTAGVARTHVLLALSSVTAHTAPVLCRHQPPALAGGPWGSVLLPELGKLGSCECAMYHAMS